MPRKRTAITCLFSHIRSFVVFKNVRICVTLIIQRNGRIIIQKNGTSKLTDWSMQIQELSASLSEIYCRIHITIKEKTVIFKWIFVI